MESKNDDVVVPLMPILVKQEEATYTMQAFCQNCFYHGDIRVPRGVSFDLIEEAEPCPKCGCLDLTRDYGVLLK
jgi:hypothetical protein